MPAKERGCCSLTRLVQRLLLERVAQLSGLLRGRHLNHFEEATEGPSMTRAEVESQPLARSAAARARTRARTGRVARSASLPNARARAYFFAH